jgi:hypothetical protein
VEALRTKRVKAYQHVVAIENGVACFDDGHSEPVDAVIFATGYERKYPLLDSTIPGGKALGDTLPFLIFHPTDPSLACLSEAISPCGCWPIFREQGRALAAFFAAEQEQASTAAAFNARRLFPSPDVKRDWYKRADGFHVNAGAYLQTLQKLTAWLSTSRRTVGAIQTPSSSAVMVHTGDSTRAS